jgi:rod shape-determining protein MreC
MKVQRRPLDAALCTGLLVLPVVLLKWSAGAPSSLNPIDRLILGVSAPLQAAVTGAAGAVAGAARRYVLLVGVERENERLRREVDRLRAELGRAERDAQAARGLERLLGLREALGSRVVAARIVGADASPYFRVARLRLDRGGGEVEPGAAVVSPSGVVGRVQRVYGRWSDVLLAVDPSSSVDVTIARSSARGIVRGRTGRDRYRFSLEYVERDADVKVGDQLVTSGAGGVFPQGVPVGSVARLERGGGLFLEADVEPSVDFSRIGEVLVAAVPPPRSASGSEQAAPSP